MLLTTKKTRPLSSDDREQDTIKLRAVWKNINYFSCPHNYNFHLHTSCSDGQLTPELLVEQALSIGLQGFAITDHHSVKGFDRARNYLREKSHHHTGLPHLWTGIEITSELNGTNVHILGYGFNPEVHNLQKYLTGNAPVGKDAQAKNVIKTLHQAGGLVVLAHPARYRRSAEELITEAYSLGIDGVETYYAYTNPNPWQPSKNQTSIVKSMAKKYNLYTTCGTDTHGSNILVRL
ncbi:PHP domain-containing protein [Geminocystis sp. NIES-3709]|uniref:PHP domain-containing protein n=1 Tax=Geminocystis sp. NIES-3709 TaxID=1617448 RepID=UPI0005FC59AB|nr:PHP domain-containing protein [Geminocystis sp. NIES-3709]BAQ66546.1 PHP family metal-dependent phosphoesterase [Geminocystis sp. NIES-3709]